MKNKAPARRLLILVICLPLVAIGIGGCRVKRENLKLSPEEYLDLGSRYEERKNYEKAAKVYEEAFAYYPRHELAPNILLSIANAYFVWKKYEPAHINYSLFYDFYPRHEEVELAVYRKGVCSFEKRLSIDRDLARSRRAISEFQILLNDFPTSPYTPQAREYILKLRDDLARHEFYVGRFYYRFKAFDASLKRFAGLHSEYPDFSDLDHSYFLMGKTLVKLEEYREAEDRFDRILTNFPDSRFVNKAERQLRRLRNRYSEFFTFAPQADSRWSRMEDSRSVRKK